MKLVQTNLMIFKKVIQQGQEADLFTSDIDVEHLIHFTMGAFRLQMLKWKLANFSFDIQKKGMNTMNNLLTLIKNKK